MENKTYMLLFGIAFLFIILAGFLPAYYKTINIYVIFEPWKGYYMPICPTFLLKLIHEREVVKE